MSEKDLTGTIFLGKYKILRLIDHGGMDSDVYLAENIEASSNDYFSLKYKYAAVKIIHKTSETTTDHWNRILDEGVTNARLKYCDNIVELLDWVKPDDHTIVLILEYVNGPSLKSLIRDRGKLSVDESIWIFENILKGIDYMQNQTGVIIHRDLKPENILMSKDCLKVKISDFGISSVVMEKANSKKYLTDEESFFGTIPYLTPDVTIKETIDGKKIPMISKQYDFHALGIIFYEMLTGNKPFDLEDENDPKSILYFKNFDLAPLSKIDFLIPVEIENIILRLTASKPNDIHLRYKSTKEIFEDLNNVKNKVCYSFTPKNSVKPYEKRCFQTLESFKISYHKDFFKFIFKPSFFNIVFFSSVVMLIVFVIFFITMMVA